MLELVAAAVVVLLALYVFRRKPQGRLPPGPKGKPFLGVALELDLQKPQKTLTTWAHQYGNLFSFRTLGFDNIVFSDAMLVRKAYAGDGHQDTFNDRPPTFSGEYLVFEYKDVGYASYEDAVKLRKVLFKGLHFYGDGVKKFETIVQTEMERLVNQLGRLKGDVVDPRTVLEPSFCGLISLLLTGEHVDPETSKDNAIIGNYIRALNVTGEPMYDTMLQVLPFLRLVPGPFRRKYLNTLNTRDVVLERFYEHVKRNYVDGKERGLVDVLLRLQRDGTTTVGTEPLQDDHIRGIVCDAVAAGTLTSTNSLLGTLLVLLHHPACIDRIRQEVDHVVGRGRIPRFEDRLDMPYTDAVILEGLRFITIFPLMVHSVRRDTNFEGYDIPKGTHVFANVWHIHHNEDIWGDPWAFRPERFLDEEGRLLDPSSTVRQWFLSFGVGRRSCVGETFAKSRIFLYLATLIQNFDLKPTDNLRSHDPRTFSSAGLILECPEYHCRFVPRD